MMVHTCMRVQLFLDSTPVCMHSDKLSSSSHNSQGRAALFDFFFFALLTHGGKQNKHAVKTKGTDTQACTHTRTNTVHVCVYVCVCICVYDGVLQLLASGTLHHRLLFSLQCPFLCLHLVSVLLFSVKFGQAVSGILQFVKNPLELKREIKDSS